MQSRKLTAVGAWLLSGLLLGGACAPDPSAGKTRSDPSSKSAAGSTSDPAHQGKMVATVGRSPIRTAEVAIEMRRIHVDARRALENLVTFELLAQAAAEAHTDLGVWGAEAIQSIRVQRLLEREIEPRLAPGAVPEADVRALYDRNKKRFVHGRLVEVAVLSLFTGARMKAEPRAAIQDSARRMAAFIGARASAGTVAVFEAIAKDPAWIARRVSLTTVWQGDDEPFPPVVGRAVMALSKPGDTTELVGDETGYYIARYVSERPPENVTFSTAAPRIREEMYEPWRRQEFMRLAMAYGDRHEIQVFSENVEHLVTDSVAP